MRKASAYTFIEMMMALCIIAILAAMTLPAMQQYFQQTSSQVIQADIVHIMQQAVQESRIRYQSIGLCQTADQQTCTLGKAATLMLFVDKNRNGTLTDSSQLIIVKQLVLHGGTLYSRLYPSYRHYFLFQPDSLNRMDNGSFWFCRREEKMPAWAVVMGKAGNIHIVLPNKLGEMRDTRGKLLTCE